METEVTIKIPIKTFINNQNYKQSIVIYYDNDLRITDKTQQIKKTVRRNCYLKWFNNTFLPCTYTVSNEYNTNINLYLCSIRKIITRFTLYEANFIRITVEFENNRYFLKGETENVENIQQFYELYLCYLNNFDHENQYDKIHINSYNNVPSRPFGIYNLGDDIECRAVKYKFDGYKAKLFILSGIGYLIRPVDTLITKIDIPQLKEYDNFFYQVECMDDKIIITDVIGVYINGDLYSPNPVDALEHLKYLNINGIQIVVDNKLYRIYNQYTIQDGPPIDKYDGYIFVTMEKEYKVKIPTVDLELKNNFFYYNNNDNKIQVNDFKYNYEDGIYEVTFTQSFLKYKVLRQRFDRHCACKKEEYDAFCISTQKWKEFLPRI